MMDMFPIRVGIRVGGGGGGGGGGWGCSLFVAFVYLFSILTCLSFFFCVLFFLFLLFLGGRALLGDWFSVRARNADLRSAGRHGHSMRMAFGLRASTCTEISQLNLNVQTMNHIEGCVFLWGCGVNCWVKAVETRCELSS